MWIRKNANPDGKHVGDCVIRALSTALGKSWEEVYDDLYRIGRKEHNMENSDEIWGLYLYNQGFEPFIVSDLCPRCLTIRDFCRYYREGIYVIGTGTHAVAVIDGDYYDTWDCGDVVPSFFWRIA